MQDVSSYFDAPALVVESYQHDRTRELDHSIENVQEKHLVWLVVLINVLSAVTFTLASALTSEAILMTRFWVGAFLGAIVYGLMIIGAWTCGGV
jgi:uncharacterized membrane protein YagU involved in acid resistance